MIRTSLEVSASAGRCRAVMIIAVLPAVWFGGAGALAGPRNIKVGDPIGTLELSDLDGKAIDAAKWIGSPSVWIFVSAEQVSSETALKDLQTVLDSLVGSNIKAVALTSDAARVPYFRQLRTRGRIRIPIVLDVGRTIYGRIGVIVLPTTLIIDKDGKVYHILSGHNLAYKKELSAHLSFLAGRINVAELKRRLTTTQPARDPARERAERLCRSAEIMIRRGLPGGAAADLRRAIEADPNYLPAYVRLAELETAKDDYAAAEKLIDAVRKIEPSNRHAKLVLGVVRFHQKRLDDAKALLEEALLLNPDPVKTRYWLGRVYEAMGDPEKAAAQFRAAVENMLPELRPSPGAGRRN